MVECFWRIITECVVPNSRKYDGVISSCHRLNVSLSVRFALSRHLSRLLRPFTTSTRHNGIQTRLKDVSRGPLEPHSTTRTAATNTSNEHHQRTSSQQFYKFATSQCQSPTSRHVRMLGCGKFLSVGGVRSWCRSRCPCSGVWL